jgi:uncharacterized NAD-dependent epimerase/dehydratase family protein
MTDKRRAIAEGRRETDLPVTDQVRFDASVLVEAVIESAGRSEQAHREAPAAR